MIDGQVKGRALSRGTLGAVVALGTCLAAFAACAHPDISLSYRLLFDLDEAGKVAQLGESWTFDPNFSQELLAEFDADHDGDFDQNESDQIRAEVLSNLSEVRYFTYVSAGDDDLGTLQPVAFRAAAENGTVTVALVLRLPHPVDAAKAPLSVEIEDPDFAVFATPLSRQAAEVRGDPDGHCQVETIADTTDPDLAALGGGQTIRLTCR